MNTIKIDLHSPIVRQILLCLSICPVAFAQSSPWVAPANAAKTKNPIQRSPVSIAAGKAVFESYCAMCHGAEGNGDGVAAAGLNVPPADFSREKVKQQTDGALFWMISTGRAPMPSFEQVLSKEQIWQVVDYIRTLEAK